MEEQAFRELTYAERTAHLPDGVLASGESNFFDTDQSYDINSVYPSPSDFDSPPASPDGIYATYARNDDRTASTPMFNPLGLVSTFSNAAFTLSQIIYYGIYDFTIFNPYIHYYGIKMSQTGRPPRGTNTTQLPYKKTYISDYDLIEPHNTYAFPYEEPYNTDTGDYAPRKTLPTL